MIELDGSFGEGGGQILRSSLALALLTGKPFRLRHIRARRPKPGLQPQHLMCVRAAAQIGQAMVRGDSQGSSELVFEPGEVVPGNYHFAIGTAGATGLVLHTLYLPLALRTAAASEVVVSGGTHVKSAPCYHFLETTWRGYMNLFGLRLKVQMRRPGFYPRGGGAVQMTIQPVPSLPGWQQPAASEPVTRANITSAAADLPDHVAERQAERAGQQLRRFDRHVKADAEQQRWQNGPGSMLAISLHTQPVPTLFFALGERGKKAERVADEAVAEAIAFLQVEPPAVDLHSADQIVLPLALAEGPSSFAVAQVTRHLTTNIAVLRTFLEREIQCEGEEGQPGRVRIV